MRTTDGLSVTIRPGAGEEKGGGAVAETKGNLQRAPLCFCHLCAKLEERGGGGSRGEFEENAGERERVQMDHTD